MAPKKKPLKDLTPKSTDVRGGRADRARNDNITLMRAARPVVRKDRPQKKDSKSGKKSA